MKWSTRRGAATSGDVAWSAEAGAVIDLVDDPVIVLAPEFAPDGSVVDAVFVQMNAAACADLGVDEPLLGESVTAWYLDTDRLFAAARQAWETGTAEPYDIEVRRGADPTRRRIHSVRTRRVGRHVVQVSPEVTDSHQLRRELERYAALLEMLDDAAILVEPIRDGTTVVDGRIRYANRATTDHFVVGPEVLARSQGTTIADYQHGPSGPAILDVVARAADGERASVVIDNTGRDHPLLRHRFVRFLAYPDSSGAVVLFIQDASIEILSQRRSVLSEAFAGRVVAGLDQPALSVRAAPDGVVVEQCNAAAEALSQCLPDPVEVAVRRALDSGQFVETVLDATGSPWDAVRTVTVTPVSNERAAVVLYGRPTG